MFNLSNKKKEENPIFDMFSDLSTNQKMSLMNLLLLIGFCDGEEDNKEKELQYLDTYFDILDICSDKSMAYLESHGYERIIEDLNSISKSQKEFLVVAAWEMIICEGRPNQTELEVARTIFEEIGVSDKQFDATIEKTQAMRI
jgi:uncharacterized tellurite resistance protein B-like protein